MNLFLNVMAAGFCFLFAVGLLRMAWWSWRADLSHHHFFSRLWIRYSFTGCTFMVSLLFMALGFLVVLSEFATM